MVFRNSDDNLSRLLIAIIELRCNDTLLENVNALLVVVVVLQFVYLSIHHVEIWLTTFICVIIVQQYRGVSHARSVTHFFFVAVRELIRLVDDTLRFD